jgi:RNA polymerase sigma factor (sigma-70 family)
VAPGAGVRLETGPRGDVASRDRPQPGDRRVRRRTPTPVDPDAVASRIDVAARAHEPTSLEPPPDERERLRAALWSLPEEQRRALVLSAYLGRTAQEISELDGVALGTVKWRIRAAMLKLRSELEESYVP